MKRMAMVAVAVSMMAVSSAAAQTPAWHVNCRSAQEVTAFEPSITTLETCVDFFSYRVNLGQPTSGRPDLVWTHDGTGWTVVASPTATPAQTCNPYDLDMLNTSPACESFRHPIVPAPAPLAPFMVGSLYQEPYTSRIVIVGAFTHRADGTPFWVAECLTTSPTCRQVGQALLLEQQDRQTWTAPVER